MESDFRKVRLLENTAGSLLVRVEDEHGNDFHVLRKRVHMVGADYIIATERKAILLRQLLVRQQEREIKRAAKVKLAAEVRESKIEEAA
jgi:hypothetical protein